VTATFLRPSAHFELMTVPRWRDHLLAAQRQERWS